jgi:hypothetical protein
MRRVGSPYVVPLLFILLTIMGVILALITSRAIAKKCFRVVPGCRAKLAHIITTAV